MQWIFRLIVLAACFELSSARPARVKMSRGMAGAWLQQTSADTDSITDHEAPSDTFPTPRPALLYTMIKTIIKKIWHPNKMTPGLAITTTLPSLSHTRVRKRHGGEQTLAVLPKTESTQFPPKDTIWRTQLGLRRTHRGVNVDLSKSLQKESSSSLRLKRSVTPGLEVRHRGYWDVKFRREGDLAVFLTPTPSGLQLATQQANYMCFRAHIFQVLGNIIRRGRVVVLETHDRGRYLQVSNDHISFVATEGNLESVSRLDNRFFLLYSPVGDNYTRIKHLISDLHLQATDNNVTLITIDSSADNAEGINFESIRC